MIGRSLCGSLICQLCSTFYYIIFNWPFDLFWHFCSWILDAYVPVGGCIPLYINTKPKKRKKKLCCLQNTFGLIRPTAATKTTTTILPQITSISENFFLLYATNHVASPNLMSVMFFSSLFALKPISGSLFVITRSFVFFFHSNMRRQSKRLFWLIRPLNFFR